MKSKSIYALNLFNITSKREYLAYLKRSGEEVTTHNGIALVTPRWKVRLANLLGFNRFTKLKLVLKAENKRFLKPGDKVTVSGEWLGEVETIIQEY
jgi:hypothetical protein